MRQFYFFIRALRKLYLRKGLKHKILLSSEQNPDRVSELIYTALMANEPCMVGRFGANELSVVVNFLGIKNGLPNLLSYIRGRRLDWVWNDSLVRNMHTNAGFFPPTLEKITKFCELMLHDMQQIDVLGSWQQNELYVQEHLKNATLVRLMYLDPFWTKVPWTRALKGKKVLVVHPFAKSILSQYKKRELLFTSSDILPEFKSFEVIQAVQSLGSDKNQFKDWFEALKYMEDEVGKHDFDVCLIGCGAYGFPLAAHVKRMGKKSVHLGGSLQLLFGIRGKRWEVNDPHYEPGNVFIDYYSLPNEHWVRPAADERPDNHSKVEDSCYW
jgi:hypothetical protein